MPHSVFSNTRSTCLRNCLECHRICTEAAAHVLHGAHLHSEAKHLVALLDAEEPAVRLRAARAILSLGLRLYDQIDLEERIRAVEDEATRRQGYEP